jgi:hypothetical protein
MDAERTFWEKATASRDTGTMWLAWTMLALQKPPSSIRELAQAVASHKSMFFAERTAERTFIDYVSAVNGGLQLTSCR